MEVKLFKVNTLQGKTYSFDLNCNDNVKSFRSNIDEPTFYTIIYKGIPFIYANDEDTKSIGELMMLTDENMLTLDTIQCHLTLNFGFPSLRQGKLLVTQSQQEVIENSNTNTSIDLICPISLQTIQYAIKINNKFYDLDAIAEYLANAFNNSQGPIPKCPMRIDLPEKLITCIYNHHYSKPKTSFSKSSMQSCLYKNPYFHCQEEYNTLIKTHL